VAAFDLVVPETAEEAIAALRTLEPGEAAPIAEEIQNQVIAVLTACSFQDLTGQRTTKVVNTLRYIEQRVNSMIELWGVEGLTRAAEAVDVEDRRPDAHLMHGPAVDGGPSQADVDALFEQLGKATEPGKGGTGENAGKGAKADKAAGDKPGKKASQSQIDAMFNAAQ